MGMIRRFRILVAILTALIASGGVKPAVDVSGMRPQSPVGNALGGGRTRPASVRAPSRRGLDEGRAAGQSQKEAAHDSRYFDGPAHHVCRTVVKRGRRGKSWIPRIRVTPGPRGRE